MGLGLKALVWQRFSPYQRRMRDSLITRMQPAAMPEWRVAPGLTDYARALAFMENHVAAMHRGHADELLWLVEHPPLYTAGTSARTQDLLTPDRFPVHVTGRGGQYTYHGPGQRVVYAMLDLNRRGRDVRAFIMALEAWIIGALADFGVTGHIRAGRVGVWVERPEKPPLADGLMAEDKIAAIGIKLRHWISFHGLAINVEPDLGHFAGIVPCGLSGFGVTSLVDLGLPVMIEDLDDALLRHFTNAFPQA